MPLLAHSPAQPAVRLRLLRLEDRITPADLSVVPLWDAERVDQAVPTGMLMNTFGGNPVAGLAANVVRTTAVAHSGAASYRVDLNVALNQFDFVGTAFAGFGPSAAYVDTRDLTNYQEARFFFRNDTGAPFTLVFELKDFQDSNAQRARLPMALGAAGGWQEVRVPLTYNPADGWVIDGTPDYSRAKLATFVFQADRGAAIAGPVFIDDLVLIEKGGPVDADTAPVGTIVDRLAYRQFTALWGARDRNTGLMPTISSFADVMGTNVTGGLVQMLPGAIGRGWVGKSAADAYVTQVVATYHTVMNNVQATGNGGFLPPRYIDRVQLTPNFAREESSVDAAFLFLALYQYKSLPGTDAALRGAIDGLLNRFDFASFSSPAGWRFAFVTDTNSGTPGDQGGFTAGTYDGYSGEVWVISLAAHLSTAHHVDITTNWNSAVNRTRVTLEGRSFVVHSSREFQEPFLQWVFPLFADVGDRGPDTFPDEALATNPLRNAVLYQQAVVAYLNNTGRGLYLQPDAADDGTGTRYVTASVFDDFGEPALFMPWSTAFGFLADPGGSAASLRHHIDGGLHGPFGLSDSVVWATGAPAPTRVTARNDLWNTTLSTLAFIQSRYGGNRFLPSLPEVRAALSEVMTLLQPGVGPAVGGGMAGAASVYVPTPSGQFGAAAATIAPFPGFTGQVRTAQADVNNDGFPDTVLVTGPGAPIRLAVISGTDNRTVLVSPYDPLGGGFTGGGFVAAADLDGDGRAEVVVTPDQGGGPRVVILSVTPGGTATMRASFFGIDDPGFRGGARAALGDVDADGTPDLVVAAGFLGGPRTAVFDGETLFTTPARLVNDFFAFPGEDAVRLRNGSYVAAGDVDGDGFADLIFGGGPGGAPRVFILSGALVSAGNVSGAQASPVANFFVANNDTDRGGVRVATKNADGDARADVVVGSGEGSPANVRVYLGVNFGGNGEPGTFQDLGVFGGAALPGGVFVG